MNKELKKEILDKILKDEPNPAFEDPLDKLIQIALKIYHLDKYAAEIRKNNKMTEAKKAK